jgi:hypothetical protein
MIPATILERWHERRRRNLLDPNPGPTFAEAAHLVELPSLEELADRRRDSIVPAEELSPFWRSVS